MSLASDIEIVSFITLQSIIPEFLFSFGFDTVIKFYI